MLFWIVLISLGVLAAWFIVLPTLNAKPKEDATRQALNVKIFQDRVKELESDKLAGRVDEEDYQALKVELERNFLSDMSTIEAGESNALLQSRWGLFVLVLILPLICGLVYRATGYNDTLSEWLETQHKLTPLIDKMSLGQLKGDDLKDVPMADFVYALQRRAQHQGDDAKLWYILGNTYLQVSGDNDNARVVDGASKALRRAYYLERTNVDYALSYAQILIQTSQGQLNPESRKVLNELLQKNPGLPAALMMLSMASYQSGDYQTAIQGWEKLLAMGNGQKDHAKAEAILKRSIAQAKTRLAQTQSGEAAESESGSLNALSIRVSTAENVKANMGYLMIYAQAEAGPPMPLAIKKLALPVSFPIDVELSDQDAMIEAMTLSKFDAVKITARISKTGNAKKEPGDYYGSVAGVKTHSNKETVVISINQIVE